MELNSFVLRCALEAIHFSFGQVTNPENPCASYYNEMWGKEFDTSVPIPKLMFSIFNGGKEYNSRIKFTRFYVILDVKPTDVDMDATEIYFKVSALIKKFVSAHPKLGENGFKPSVIGSYFNAHDQHNETFKILEEAINQVGVNTAERKYLSIGICCDSDNWYLSD